MPGTIIDAISPVRVARLALIVLAVILCGPANALAAQGLKIVSYHGYRVSVPRTWPVFDLTRDPTACVRFDRHALYLGRPGAAQQCPAEAAGRTEAIMLQLVSGRVRVTATWNRDPGLIRRALGLRSLSGLNPASGLREPGEGHASLRPRASIASATIAPGTIYTGPGFDVCSTPSASQMSAWGSSRYHAVGIYIGGTNMACAQPNLSPGWISGESAAGWHLIPIYVGLQAPSNSCGCTPISPSDASSEGTAAAEDAVNQAEELGMGPGNPIYFDMEAYPRGGSNTSAVLAFLESWTEQLHAEGYKSGVYSSDDSGISDLVSEWETGYLEPDEIWIANWNGEQTTSDPNVPAGDWASNQRLHQYEGGHNETHGGVTLNIDGDYLDGATAAPGSVAGAAAEPTASSPPTITGTAAEGQTLSEAHGAWPPTPVSYSYQWEDCNGNGISCAPIAGATGQTYTVATSDVGHTIRATEVAAYTGGPGVPAVSEPTAVVMSPTPLYWLFTGHGNVYPSPGTAWYQSPSANGYRGGTIVGMAATADGKGYWVVGAKGGVYAYGDATSSPAQRHAHPIIGVAAASGGGYWRYTAYGNVYPSAGTSWYGSPSAGGLRHHSIVGMAATPDGKGYWLVNAAGRVFAYGDAASYARLAHAHPIKGIVAAPAGGYWLYTAYGNVYETPGTPWDRSPVANGFRGSSIAGMAATPDGMGYWLVGRGGTVYAFGDADPFPRGQDPHAIVGISGG